MDDKIHITDYTTLLDLRESIRLNSEQMLSTVNDADNYFDGILAEMQQKIQLLKAEVDNARLRVEQAQHRLDDARSRQRWDEEKHCYYPSCSSEEAAVHRAESQLHECERCLEEGQTIFDDCNREVTKWRDRGGVITPPGGRELMRWLCGEHTEKTLQKLSDIIDATEDIMGAAVALGQEVMPAETVRINALESSNSTNDVQDRVAKFKEATEMVRQRGIAAQYNEAPGVLHQYMESTDIALCELCGRPLIACICPRGEREREHTNFYRELIEHQNQR